MRFCVVNIHDTLPLVSTGISAIGYSLLYGGNTVEYISLGAVMAEPSKLFDKNFDVIIITTAGIENSLNTIKRLREDKPKTRIISFADGCYGRLDWDAKFELKSKLLKIFNLSDLVLTNSNDNYNYYKEWVEDKVVCPGFPVNISFVEEWWNYGWKGVKIVVPEVRQTENNLVWAGYFDHRPYHDILVILKLLKNIGMRALITGLSWPSSESTQRQVLNNLELDNVELHKATTPRSFIINHLRRCSMATYFTTRASLGRTATECAVVGIPCLGARDFFQQRLWPDLSLDYVDLSRIKDLIMLLNTDISFRKMVCEKAYDRVQEFEPEKFAKRLIPILMEGE